MSVMTEANRDQAALWNDASGRTWADMQGLLDRMLQPFADRLVADAFPGEGRWVLDVGCGAGATTLAMARRLGPQGLCLGVDISAPLVAAAKARAEAEDLESAGFVEADAQTYRFDPGVFDAVISRFGVMFFEDPEAAFANIRKGVRPDGDLTFAAWRSPAENPLVTTVARAAAPLLPPTPPPIPNAPGQFGFADGERTRGILEAAGWRDVEVKPLDMRQTVPEADLMAYVTRLGPVGGALRNADDATKAKVTAALKDAIQPFVQDGEARFTSACWLVTARA